MSEQSSAAGVAASLQNCQRAMRLATGIILGAFVLIIGMTTVSTGPAVQFFGKALYYVIVLSILISLGIWYYRSRLEKRLESRSVAGEAVADVVEDRLQE